MKGAAAGRQPAGMSVPASIVSMKRLASAIEILTASASLRNT